VGDRHLKFYETRDNLRDGGRSVRWVAHGCACPRVRGISVHGLPRRSVVGCRYGPHPTHAPRGRDRHRREGAGANTALGNATALPAEARTRRTNQHQSGDEDTGQRTNPHESTPTQEQVGNRRIRRLGVRIPSGAPLLPAQTPTSGHHSPLPGQNPVPIGGPRQLGANTPDERR